MTTLHLTKDEIAMFEKLPAALREGWVVKEETLEFYDTDDRMRVRMDMLRIKNPALLAFKTATQGMKSPDDVYAAAKKLDLSDISDDDLGELLFALGPNGVSVILHVALQGGLSTDQELSQFASMTEVRHGLLKSLQSITF